jgi:glycosyltransferase involved in cell wall biosynthesis
MSAPFFSILLPTRNRSEIVGGAIRSVLQQADGDWELIVSDNDESPTATRDAVAAIADSRIRYFRTTGQLSMHDNWENALRQATGVWVLILEDKLRLTPGALPILRQLCEANPDSIVSYRYAITHRDDFAGPSSAGGVKRYSCEHVAEEFCSLTQLSWDFFPRGLTSCAPRRMLDAIRASSPTGMVYSHINPDYSSGFMQLSVARDMVHLPEPLVIIPPSVYGAGKSYSNGKAGIMKAESFRKFLASLPVTREQMLEGMPIRSEYLWVNPVIYDFRVFYRRPGHRPEIDWVGYHAQCLHIMMMGWLWGSDMRPELAELWASVRRSGFLFGIKVAAVFFWRSLRAAFMRVLNRIRH